MANEIKSARDALESISAWAEANLRDYGGDWRMHNILCEMLKAALSTPPRICDRYRTLAAALDAWRDVDPREAGTFDDWLFAEAEGSVE